MKHHRGYDSRVHLRGGYKQSHIIRNYNIRNAEGKLHYHIRAAHNGIEDPNCNACKELKAQCSNVQSVDAGTIALD